VVVSIRLESYGKRRKAFLPNPAKPEPTGFSLKENDPDIWFTVGLCPYLFREI
jgi:hypothetical protein